MKLPTFRSLVSCAGIGFAWFVGFMAFDHSVSWGKCLIGWQSCGDMLGLNLCILIGVAKSLYHVGQDLYDENGGKR